MPSIEIYTKDYCSFCYRAKELLRIKGVPFTEIDVTNDPHSEQLMRKRSGRATVPQIFIGDRHLGGCDDLFALDEEGDLDPILSQLDS